MSKEPLLSIITVNLNDIEGLKRTVNSVLEQTWQEFEYVVIDGGSTDGSKECLLSHTNNIGYWISEPDSGIFNAMNKGIKSSTGKYLLFLNSGDSFVNEKALAQTIKYLRKKDFIYFNLEMYDNNRRFIKYFPEILSFSFFINHSLPHPSTFIKKEILVEAGLYDESYKIISDWKFFIDAVCKKNCSYLYVNEDLTSFNLFGISSKDETKIEMYQERNKFLRENYSAFLQDSRELENCEVIISQLRSSRKVSLLVKLGLIKKF